MTLEEKASLLIGATSQAETSGAMVGATKNLWQVQPEPRRPFPTGHSRHGVDRRTCRRAYRPTRKGETKTYYATGFPIGTALPAHGTRRWWNRWAKAIGNEVLEYGCDVILGPGMNIHRNPLCGPQLRVLFRRPDTMRQDCWAYVRGVQSQGVGTSIKHFAVNSRKPTARALMNGYHNGRCERFICEDLKSPSGRVNHGR